MTPRFNRLSKLYILFCISASLGCSKGYQLAPVSGRVEVDHHPLAHADVTFSPVGGDKNLPTSSGKTDEQGIFKLIVNDLSRAEGAVVGENQVSISVDVRSQDKKAVVTHMRKLEQLPSRYNNKSELKFNVPAGGTTEANFLDLKSR